MLEEKMELLFQDFEKLFNDNKNEFNYLTPFFEEWKKHKLFLSKPLYKIAVFGPPRLGKSRFLNFLLSGNKDEPLPNEHKKGVGVTKYPYKCKISETNEYAFNYEERIICKHIDELTKRLQDHNSRIRLENTIRNYKDIIIEIPLNYTNRTYLESIEFIDCIGLPDEYKSEATQLIKHSIGESVDGIFYFNGSSASEDHFGYMNECGLFSFISSQSQIVPKCVHIFFEDLIGQDKIFDGNDFNENSKMKVQLETVLEKGFKSQSQLNYNLSGNYLEDMCDSICLVRENGQKEFKNEEELKKIIENIKKSRRDVEERLAFSKMIEILDDIETSNLAKMRNKRKDKKGIFHRLATYFYDKKQKQFKKKKKKEIDNIGGIFRKFMECLKDFDLDEEFSSGEMSTNTTLDQMDTSYSFKHKYVNVRLNKLQEELSTIFDNFQKTISDKIDELVKDYFDLAKKDIVTVTELDKIKIRLDEKNSGKLTTYFNDIDTFLIKYINEVLNSETDSEQIKDNFPSSELLKVQELLVHKLEKEPSLIISNNDKPEIKLTKELNDFKIKHKSLSPNIRNQSDQKEEPKSNIKLNIFSSPKSNKLPKNKDLMKNGKLIDINLKHCKKEKWISDKQPKFAEKWSQEEIGNLKIKSKLEVNLLEPSDEYKKEIMEYGSFIQIENVEKLDNDTFRLNIMCDREYFRKKNDALNENILKYHSDRSENNQFENISLNSILMFSERKNDPNINLLADQLKQTVKAENFLIYLFIVGGTQNKRSYFSDEIDFFNTIRKKHSDSIHFVFLPKRYLSGGCIRKLMMLMADHLGLSRFYIIKDNIESFKEFYKSQYGYKKYFSHEHATARALAFMSIVLENGILGHDNQLEDYIPSDKEKNILYKSIFKLGDSPILEQLMSYEENKIKIKDLFKREKIKERIIEENLNVDKEFFEIEAKIFGPYSKTLGQVSLLNNSKITLDLYTKIDMATHKIVKQGNYDVVLFNEEAIQNIHQVSDLKLYECLQKPISPNLESSSNQMENNDREKCKPGYYKSDEYQFYHQILNGVSGYVIHYFSFKEFSNNKVINSAIEEAYTKDNVSSKLFS
jgi:hypothetical protein